MKRISTIEALKKGLFHTFKKNIILPQKAVTNDGVRQLYLNCVYKSGLINSSNFALIKKMVDKDVIIPIECTDDYIKELNSKLDGSAAINPKEYEGVLGFYTGYQNKIFILMDHVEKLMRGNTKGLFFVTIHELQHMSCYNFPKQFISTWNKELCKFYAYFVFRLYEIITKDTNNNEIIRNLMDPGNGLDYYIQYLIYNNEFLWNIRGSRISSKDCATCAMKIAAIANQCGVPEKVAVEMYHTLNEFMYDILFRDIGSTYNKNNNPCVIRAFNQAYIDVFGINMLKYSFIYQEAIFPSEVVCMSSMFKYTDNRYYKFLNNL